MVEDGEKWIVSGKKHIPGQMFALRNSEGKPEPPVETPPPDTD
jgi:hypothetical protein